MVLIKLTSDNYSSQLMTAEAYEMVVLEMSTGDHATHRTEVLVSPQEHILDTYSVLHAMNGELVNIGAEV